MRWRENDMEEERGRRQRGREGVGETVNLNQNTILDVTGIRATVLYTQLSHTIGYTITLS